MDLLSPILKHTGRDSRFLQKIFAIKPKNRQKTELMYISIFGFILFGEG